MQAELHFVCNCFIYVIVSSARFLYLQDLIISQMIFSRKKRFSRQLESSLKDKISQMVCFSLTAHFGTARRLKFRFYIFISSIATNPAKHQIMKEMIAPLSMNWFKISVIGKVEHFRDTGLWLKLMRNKWNPMMNIKKSIL